MPSWDISFELRIDTEDRGVVAAVAHADALANVIRGLPIPPQVRDQLDRLNIRRAVRGTTGIEGAEVTDEEVERILASAGHPPALPRSRAREEQEVRNAGVVVAYVAASVRQDPQAPLTLSIIRRIHELTTQGIDYAHNSPGVYRSHAVDAGPTYKPPRSHEEVVRYMDEFMDWLRGPASTLPPAIKAIAAHSYLVSIHPFGDGNGRTARAVESFLLYQARINALGFYSLSNFYYLNRDRYIELLDHVRFSSSGDLTPFIRFALDGLVSELETVHAEVLDAMSAIAFRDFAHYTLLQTGKLGTKNGRRMYELLVGLGEPVAIADIRNASHPLASLYRRLSNMTLTRDLDFLRTQKLIVVERGVVRANLELMRDFTS